MKLRSLIFWPHLVAGVSAGIVILLMCVTGVLLTYERQLIAWADSGYRSTKPSAEARALSMETLLARVQDAQPDLEPTTITLRAGEETAVAVAAGQRTLYVDRYSGAVVGKASRGGVRKFMADLRAWHRWLAVEGEGRTVARAVTGWSNAIFLFIVASGIYLWFPRRWTWQRVRPVVLFSGKVRGKARDFNWHNVIGAWSAVPLFIVVLTAMPISFPWANAFVYRAVGEEPPQQGGRGGREGGAANARGREGAGGGAGRPARGGERTARDREEPGGEGVPSLEGLDRLWSVAERQVPGWRTINLRLPATEQAPVVFAIDRGDGGQPQHRSTLTLERASASVVSFETFSDQSLGRRLRSISRFAHTGEVLGLPGQTVAGLVTGGAVVLVWTGIALTLRRFRAWIARQSKRAVETADSRDAPAA